MNFCKFTNETRNSIEDATAHSGQTWIAAVNGTAAGGGYELALACDEILLVDDRASAVSLPEVPLLAVLPGTGGLTRVVDKRHVRRDLADVFATRTEGVKGRQAVEWGLVDAIAPTSRFDELVHERALARRRESARPDEAGGVALTPLERDVEPTTRAALRARRASRSTAAWAAAHITVRGPDRTRSRRRRRELRGRGASAWLLAAVRELDDALLHLRFNEPEIGTWVLRHVATRPPCSPPRRCSREHADHWLVSEVRLLLGADAQAARPVGAHARRAGRAGELLRRAPRRAGPGRRPLVHARRADPRRYRIRRPRLRLTEANDGWFPMSNGLDAGWPPASGAARDALERPRDSIGKDLLAAERRSTLGLVTFAPDDIDWDDEVRLALEERNSFSPDALTGMEANCRFAGPETMETKIFARLSAWQNWIFQRPNAVGPEGALRRFGSGSRPTFDRTRT